VAPDFPQQLGKNPHLVGEKAYSVAGCKITNLTNFAGKGIALKKLD
jgi:hypothetical protein